MNEHIGKYYVISITTFSDGTKAQYGVTSYDDYNSALKVFHQKFANVINVDNIQRIMVQIVNDYGVVSQSEYWEAPTEETTEK